MISDAGSPSRYQRTRWAAENLNKNNTEQALRWDVADAAVAHRTAIHRTAITDAGAKVGRKTLGPNAGCVIRLWPDEAVERGLVIGEGIETMLAATTRIQHRGTLLTPAWATGDAGHLEKFPILPGIEALTELVDHDENGNGQRATAEC